MFDLCFAQLLTFLGQVRLGQVRFCWVKLGYVMLGQVRLGQVRLIFFFRNETFLQSNVLSFELLNKTLSNIPIVALHRPASEIVFPGIGKRRIHFFDNQSELNEQFSFVLRNHETLIFLLKALVYLGISRALVIFGQP